MSKLNPKQKRFADEYLVDHNATQALIRAGYSKRNARVTSCKLLAHPNISAYIAKKEKKITEELNITAESIVAEIAVIAFGEYTGRDLQAKLKALDMLGRYQGIFERDNNQKTPVLTNMTYVIGDGNAKPYVPDPKDRIRAGGD